MNKKENKGKICPYAIAFSGSSRNMDIFKPPKDLIVDETRSQRAMCYDCHPTAWLQRIEKC